MDFIGPGAFEHYTVEMKLRKKFDDGAFAPSFNALKNLLVEITDSPRTDPRAPQSVGDVFDTTGRHTNQLHLDECFFNRRLSALVPFDDGCLELVLA